MRQRQTFSKFAPANFEKLHIDRNGMMLLLLLLLVLLLSAGLYRFVTVNENILGQNDARARVYTFRDPSERPACLFIHEAALQAARSAAGTDDDVIFVSLGEQGQHLAVAAGSPRGRALRRIH